MGVKLWLVSSLIVPCLVACGGGGGGGGDGGGGPGPVGTDLVVHGIVNQIPESSGGDVEPIAGAEVRATIDRNHDGRITSDERVTVTADSDGRYQIGLAVEDGDVVVLRFNAPGSAPVFRTIRAGRQADITMTVGLRNLEELTEGTRGRLVVESMDLSIANLAGGLTGSARVFNPVNDAASFPGGFSDSDGNLLISGVFSTVELTDGEGEVHDLDSPAELRMKLPVDTWNIVVDILPGNDRIDVPMYAFDEVLGTWVREGEGYLEDASGRILSESELPAVRDGSFAGVIYAASVVRHFSYWNVDWPVEAHGCLTGRVILEDGQPAVGATVSLSGVTYTGSSSAITVGADGRFCLEMMRSESATEDIDQDGIPGETHRVRLRIAHAGKLYEGGTFDTPNSQGTCADGNCTDVGDIPLDAASELQPVLCTVSGRVIEPSGTPAEGAMVWAMDETIPSELETALCGEYLENCTFITVTDADGRFEIRSISLDGLLVSAWNATSEGDATLYQWGERRTSGCPAAPIEVRLDSGMVIYNLAIEVRGNTIEWVPNTPVSLLYVLSAGGQYKWMIGADDDGTFSGPVVYGQVPAGASQYLPWEAGGSIPPLANGDLIGVMATGVDPRGYQYMGTGQIVYGF